MVFNSSFHKCFSETRLNTRKNVFIFSKRFGTPGCKGQGRRPLVVLTIHQSKNVYALVMNDDGTFNSCQNVLTLPEVGEG